MAKRMAPKEITPRHLTKKHLARAEREQRQQRILLSIAIPVLAVIVGLMVYGILMQYVIGPNRPVVIVNGEKTTVSEFVAAAKMRRIQNLLKYNQDKQYASVYTQLGLDISSTLQNDMTRIETEMSDATALGQAVITSLVEDTLLKAEAAKLGIAVSAEELEQAVEEYIGYYANGAPTPTATSTRFITPTYSLTQIALLATQTATIGVPESTSTPTIEFTSTPTDSVTATVSGTDASLVSTPTTSFTPTTSPTPTQYTYDIYQKNLGTFLKNVGTYGVNETGLRDFLERQLLRLKIYDYVTASTATSGSQVWVRRVAVATEDEAKSVLARFDAGQTWETVAGDTSLDTNTNTRGGDLGWFPQGLYGDQIDTAAADMQIGEIRIVQTSAGWDVIQLLGKDENRPISSTYLVFIKDRTFQAWLQDLKDSATIESYSNWQEWVPDKPVLPAE